MVSYRLRYPAFVMPTFSGPFDNLKDRLLLADIEGEWIDRGNGVWQLKCPDGANMNWSSTKGTIWCDGKAVAKSALETKVAVALETSFEPRNGGLSRSTISWPR